MKSLEDFDFIITMGEMFIDSKLKISDESEFVYMHPIDNEALKGRYSHYIKYEAGSEEGVIAMLLNFFSKNRDVSVDSFVEELDIGYISAESNVGEEEIEEILELSLDKSKKALVLGNEVFQHKNIKNIKKMLSALVEFSDFEIVTDEEYSGKFDSIDEIDEISAYDGTVLYSSLNSIDSGFVIGGNSFSKAAKVNDGDDIEVIFDKQIVQTKFRVDSNLKGTIAFYSNKNSDLLTKGYPYKQVRIKKVGL